MFHFNCVKRLLEVRWNGPRITFGFCVCPICRASWVKSKAKPLKELLLPIAALYDEVRSKACLRLQYDGMVDAVEGGEDDKAIFAMSKYTYYPCFKCGKAYFGGDASCEAARGAAEFDPSELVCPTCVGGAAMQICPKHGTDFLEYKCRYCCSVAVFFCFGRRAEGCVEGGGGGRQTAVPLADRPAFFDLFRHDALLQHMSRRLPKVPELPQGRAAALSCTLAVCCQRERASFFILLPVLEIFTCYCFPHLIQLLTFVPFPCAPTKPASLIGWSEADTAGW